MIYKFFFYAFGFLIFLSGFFLSPQPAHAETGTGCQQDMPFEYTSVPNSVFADYESVEYINGYLAVHFKITRYMLSYEDWRPSFVYVDDQCRTFIRGDSLKISNPENVASLNLSLRFISPTQYIFWDDDNNTRFICGACQGEILDMGEFFKIRLRMHASYANTILGNIVSSAHNIVENPEPPPALDKTLAPSSGCPVFSVVNDMVDDYEHAEYVNGQLRMHFRKNPMQNGGTFKIKLTTYEAGCINPKSVSYNFQYYPHQYLEYFSVRFTARDGFQLWNDDLERIMDCNNSWNKCSGGIYQVPKGGFVTAGISTLAGSQWQASMTSTAFPIDEQDISPSGHSNVLFIPGIEASRLYRQDTFFENQLWEPNRHQDTQDLFLDKNGQSILQDIYTGDIIDEIRIGGGNIYKSFISMMDDMVSDNTIAGWKATPYDWRLDFPDIVQKFNMVSEIEQLAASSDSGKVTIIAHSMGGLVAKELISNLEASGKSNLVDKLILVAVPQMGTPKAIEAMLHGEDQSFFKGLFLPHWLTRGLAENMPSAYNLLPTQAYYDKVIDPVIEFDNVHATETWRDMYGDGIDNMIELNSFILGKDGREEPAEHDIITPNVLVQTLLDVGKTRADEQDNWTSPSNIKVIQIAGWGIETIRGIEYTQRLPDDETLDERPLMKTDGDGTVISYSADKLPAETYYVDLHKYNESTGTFVPSRDHADILEVDEVLTLMQNVLINTSIDLGDFLSTVRPIDENPLNRLSVHSPVSIDIYDSNDAHTGLIPNPDPDSDIQLLEEQIPNSRYYEFGEGKYVSMPAGNTYNVIIHGTDYGTFILESEEGINGNYTGGPIFSDIPVFPTSIATMTVDDSDPILSLDIDGDDTIDVTIGEGEQISASSLLYMLEYQLNNLDLNPKTIKKFDKKIAKVRKAIDKEKISNADKRLDSIIKLIEKNVKKEKLTSDQASQLMRLVELIKVAII